MPELSDLSWTVEKDVAARVASIASLTLGMRLSFIDMPDDSSQQ